MPGFPSRIFEVPESGNACTFSSVFRLEINAKFGGPVISLPFIILCHIAEPDCTVPVLNRK
ncbi:hypothetical protein J2128_000116 [Methanomicrobium sp. W14]|nr:hypothetical protein [Methanomicrobium sp. W14]